MTSQQPKDWNQWLSLAEYWFNTNYHTALKMTPFEALYGFQPPQFTFNLVSQTNVEAVDELLRQRQLVAKKLQDNLHRAQGGRKQYEDSHRTEREFAVGDWVLLKLQPYRQSSVALKKSLKLAARFYWTL